MKKSYILYFLLIMFMIIIGLNMSSISAVDNTNTTINHTDIIQNNTNNINQSIITKSNENNDNDIEDYGYNSEDNDKLILGNSKEILKSDNLNSSNENNIDKIPVNLVVNDLVKYFHNNNTLNIYLYDNNGNPLVNQKITITLQEITYNKTINSEGMACLDINLWPNTYNATIKYEGTSIYAPASKKITITILKRIPFFIDVSDNITPYEPFYFKLMDNQGYPLINKTVNLYCEGEKINLTSDNHGLCYCFLKLSPGYHNIYLNYSSNDLENSSTFSYGSIYINNFTKSFKIQDIINTAIILKDTIFKNHILPSNITISDTNLSIFEFSYLMAKTINQIYDNENTDETINLPYIYKAVIYDNYIFHNETLSYYTYIHMVNTLVDFVEDNNYLPSYLTNYTHANIDFKTYTFCFSKILSFYNLSSFLPSKIYIENIGVNYTDSIYYEFNDDYNFDSRFTNICNFNSSYTGYNNGLIETKIISENYTFNYGSVYGKIRITDNDGRGLQNKILYLKVGNECFNYTTDFWGDIYYNLNLYPGLYNLTIIFNGDKLFKTSTANYSIKILKSNILLLIKNDILPFDNNLILYMVNNDGFPVANHTITLNINNKNYTLKSDDLGYIKFNETLPIGQNILNFTFNGDETYNPLNYNFTLNIKDKTFFEGNDLTVKNGNRNLNIKLYSDKCNLVNKTIICKILSQNLNLIKNLTINTDNNGEIQIPTSNFNSGNYYVSVYYMGNDNYLNSSKIFNLKIITDGTILTYIHSKNLIIHSKGEYFVGILTDQFGNPIENVPLNILFINKNVTTTYSRITNENGTFKLQINMNNPNIYKVICKFEGNEIYSPITAEFKIDAYYKPNLIYTINITSKEKDEFHVFIKGKDVIKNLTVPYGRLIGFYKNNKLYKYTYGYTESGANNLKINKYYFFSLTNTNNIIEIKNSSIITSIGFLIYSNGANIFIRYLAYNKDKLYSLNVIYNGGKYSNKNICNVNFYYGNNKIASMFFSSEIYTSTTQTYLNNNLNMKFNSSTWYINYQPVASSTFLNNYGNYNIFDFMYENINYILLSYGGVANKYKFNKANWTNKLGYEAIESIFINTGVLINDNLMKNVTDNANNYTGVNKVVYELYLGNLAYNWLMIKSFNEISEEYNIKWDKDNYYYLIESYLSVKGRSISIWNWTSAFYSHDYYNIKQGLNKISYITSVLEEYIMSLNGDNSTCAVNEIILGLINGEDFYLNNKDNVTYFGLSDNSSYLTFTEYGGYGSYIIINQLNKKYKLNGGMILGLFNFLKSSKIVSNLKNIINSEIHNIYSKIYNQFYSKIKNFRSNNIINYLYNNVSNSRTLSGIVGGFMVNAGLIMTSSGAGAVVGIPLLAVGTICTAYSSGLINIDKNSKKISVNLTQHNAVEFGISMGLNAYDLGSEYNFINKFVKTKSIIKSIKCIQSEIKRDI